MVLETVEQLPDDASFDEIAERLEVVAAIQKGLVDVSRCAPRDHPDLERLWRDLLADDDIQLAARQVALQVSVYDIQLLLVTLLDAAGA